jgi:hypothetical protein
MPTLQLIRRLPFLIVDAWTTATANARAVGETDQTAISFRLGLGVHRSLIE